MAGRKPNNYNIYLRRGQFLLASVRNCHAPVHSYTRTVDYSAESNLRIVDSHPYDDDAISKDQAADVRAEGGAGKTKEKEDDPT